MNEFDRHLLAIEGMSPQVIEELLDEAESHVLLNRSTQSQRDVLRGRTLINLFFEDSTRTRTSFELAGKRLGADVINMSVSNSSVNKGRDAARHGDHAQRDALRPSRGPSWAVRRAGTAGPQGERIGDQCRRRYS